MARHCWLVLDQQSIMLQTWMSTAAAGIYCEYMLFPVQVCLLPWDSTRISNNVLNPTTPQLCQVSKSASFADREFVHRNQSWEKSPFSKVESSVESLCLECQVKSSDTQMQTVEVKSKVKSLLVEIFEVEVKR